MFEDKGQRIICSLISHTSVPYWTSLGKWQPILYIYILYNRRLFVMRCVEINEIALRQKFALLLKLRYSEKAKKFENNLPFFSIT